MTHSSFSGQCPLQPAEQTKTHKREGRLARSPEGVRALCRKVVEATGRPPDMKNNKERKKGKINQIKNEAGADARYRSSSRFSLRQTTTDFRIGEAAGFFSFPAKEVRGHASVRDATCRHQRHQPRRALCIFLLSGHAVTDSLLSRFDYFCSPSGESLSFSSLGLPDACAAAITSFSFSIDVPFRNVEVQFQDILIKRLFF